MSSDPPNGNPSREPDPPPRRKVERWLTPEVMERALRKAAEHAERMRIVFGDENNDPVPLEHLRRAQQEAAKERSR